MISSLIFQKFWRTLKCERKCFRCDVCKFPPPTNIFPVYDTFVDPVILSLPKILKDFEMLDKKLAMVSHYAPSSPYIPRLVPNTCGFSVTFCKIFIAVYEIFIDSWTFIEWQFIDSMGCILYYATFWNHFSVDIYQFCVCLMEQLEHQWGTFLMSPIE